MLPVRRSVPSSPGALLLVGALLVALVLSTIGLGSAAAALTPKQQAALDVKANKLIRNGRYVGTRGDGSPVDMTFCANGKYQSRVGNGVSNGKWLVRTSAFTKTGFTAILAENKDRRKGGYAIAIAKRGTKWYIGIESFNTATKLGLVARTPVSGACPAA